MRRIVLLFVLSFCPVWSLAQTTGFPPFGSFDAGGFDAVNRQNLNANFAIPIVSVPGRAIDFGFSIVYDTLIWRNGGSGTNWYVVTDPSGVATWGWKAKWPIGAISYTHTTTIRHTNCGTKIDPYIVDLQTDTWSNYFYTDPAGTPHSFLVSYTDAQNCSGGDTITGTTTGNASDGSGFFINIGTPGVSAPIVYTRSGVQITSSTLKDTNGNFISQVVVSGTETDWKDTANHTALRIVTVSPNVEYHYLDTTGTDQKYALKYQNYSIKTAFNCSGITDYNLSGTMPQVSLPYQLDLPNGQFFSFAYEPTTGSSGFYTGRLKQITVPTGGTVQYTYPATPNNGVSCTDSSVLNMTRAISDGTSTATWTYARSQVGTDWKTKISAPQLPYDSAPNESTFTYNSSNQLTSQKIYQGLEVGGTLLRTLNTSWAANGTPSGTTTILEVNQTQSRTETDFDTYGNLTELREFAFGNGAPGSLLRKTTLSYSTIGFSKNRLITKDVRDGAGVLQSKTNITYDAGGAFAGTNCITGAAQHDDASYGCSFTARGNPTSVTSYITPTGPAGAVTGSFTYDSLGNLRSSSMDSVQQSQSNYSATTQYSFADSVITGPSTGPQVTVSTTYNPWTGLAATSTDENNQPTTFSYDAFKRLTVLQRPDGTQTTYSYDDSARTVTVNVPIQGGNKLRRTTYYDPLGRPIKRTDFNAPGTTAYSTVETQYDPLGRPYKASNPHNSTAQYWAETRFDALGRATKVVSPAPDSSQTIYSYTGTTATATDATGKQLKTDADALGHLIAVYEPDVNSGNSLTQVTTYSYTALDGLATVTQGAQTRTTTFDGLGRPTSLTSPESGTTSFQYNSFNLLTQRTDARGVITTNLYDTLNRLSQMSYNVGSTGVPATPAVNFTYGTNPALNNNGRLITVADGLGSESYTYDILGRITQTQKTISGTTYPFNYAYNSAGNLTSVTYPSGLVVQQNYDEIGRVSSILSGATTYASTFAYNPSGQMTGFNYGNGAVASFGYSPDRLQLTSLTHVKGAQTLLSLAYNYGPAGSNNGQVSGITDNTGTQEAGRSVTYTYDALNRLKTAVTTGSTTYPQWGLSWTYDRYGNRQSQGILSGCSGITCPTNSVTASATTNRLLAPYSYDADGNMTNDGSNTLIYDAENRAVSSTTGGTTTTYAYDSKGFRVKKIIGSTTTVYLISGAHLLAEYVNGAVPASPTREYIYSDGQLLAKLEGTSTIYYHHDHLSVRQISDGNGQSLGQRANFPFGEIWYETGTPTKFKFTTYERDSGSNESGNDYAISRYYVNRLGRFLTPDPFAGSMANPQSLNRYAYALNDPVNRSDPSGLHPQDQHKFFTFLMGVIIGRPDAQAVALGAEQADNFLYATTGLFGLGAIINYDLHFGEPKTTSEAFALDPLNPNCTGKYCGDSKLFGREVIHLIEDNAKGAPHNKGAWAHIFGSLFGKNPDRDPNLSGFAAAWEALGGKQQDFSAQLFQRMRMFLNEHGLEVIGMSYTSPKGQKSTLGNMDIPEGSISYGAVIDGVAVIITVLPNIPWWDDPIVQSIEHFYMTPGVSNELGNGLALYCYASGISSCGDGGFSPDWVISCSTNMTCPSPRPTY